MAEDDNPESDDCIVHDHPVPPEEMLRYSPDRDPHEEQGIIDYMNGQARDEKVLHVERVKSEFVSGSEYEMWDVTTDKGSWWVLTNLTNLYSKQYFPSLDYTFSFHVGLMARLKSRDARPDPELEPFLEVSRREDQIMARWEEAVEPEDFQAIGMLLRENLVSLVRVVRAQVELSPDVVPPKASDFNGWCVVLLDHLCPGRENKELRSFMKSLSEKTWQLVCWLTHDRNATRRNSLMAGETCGLLIGHFTQLLLGDRMDADEQCPRCRSHHVRTHYDRELGAQGVHYKTCGKCGWSDHPGEIAPEIESGPAG